MSNMLYPFRFRVEDPTSTCLALARLQEASWLRFLFPAASRYSRVELSRSKRNIGSLLIEWQVLSSTIIIQADHVDDVERRNRKLRCSNDGLFTHIRTHYKSSMPSHSSQDFKLGNPMEPSCHPRSARSAYLIPPGIHISAHPVRQNPLTMSYIYSVRLENEE